MNASFRRVTAAMAIAAILSFGATGLAFANVTGKTIATTPCASDSSGCAVYGPNGFSGTISGDALTTAHLVDYICTHSPSGGAFVPYAATYTFTVFDGNTQLATTSETVGSTPDCTDGNNAVTSSGTASFTFPASGQVNYTVSIAGIDSNNATTLCPAETCNSIRNHVVDTQNGSHVESASVGVIGGPPVNVPEAPFASLLVISGGLVAAFFVWRRVRPAPAPASS